jgi:glutathione S-transferase
VTGGEFTIVTYEWVPDFPRGFVRDIRVRWAAEETGLEYRVETVPLRNGPLARAAEKLRA